MLHRTILSSLLLILVLFVACKDNTQKDLPFEKIALKYATGYHISDLTTHKELSISDPWPEADKRFKYALVSEDSKSKVTLNTEEFNGIIATPVQRIVVTSTTHIPALELLGVEQTLVGFPGTSYISSEKTRSRIDKGEVRELGNNEGVNTEVLLELRPDVVVAFGVKGTNKNLELIEKAGIPVIYNGDWVEKSPLAKAEWIKIFGLLYDKEEEASKIFSQIETDYNQAKAIAKNASKQPTVLCGAMYKDIWYLPNGTSPEAQFLKDANTNYLWQETTGSGSLALNFESVLEKAQDAELWMSPSYYKSYEELEASNSHYTEFKAFQNKNVFTFSNTLGETGGVLYYELGIARPDLVLKDMIKICHPELMPDYETTFIKPLQ